VTRDPRLTRHLLFERPRIGPPVAKKPSFRSSPQWHVCPAIAAHAARVSGAESRRWLKGGSSNEEVMSRDPPIHRSVSSPAQAEFGDRMCRQLASATGRSFTSIGAFVPSTGRRHVSASRIRSRRKAPFAFAHRQPGSYARCGRRGNESMTSAPHTFGSAGNAMRYRADGRL
jgi:hypothetical protein